MRRAGLEKNFHIPIGHMIFAFLVLIESLAYKVEAVEPFQMRPDKPPEQITGELDVWAWNIAAGSLKEVLPQFNEHFPNVKVNIHTTMANVQSRLLLSLSAGVGAPDITQLLVSETPRYISTKQMMDLTAVAVKYEKDFIPSFWKCCVYDSRIYAIPWGSVPCAVFYKRHLFKRYGIDPNMIETWDDYIEAGKVIPDQCKQKEAAWAFVEFVLCRPDIQNIQYEAFDLIPCLIPSFDGPLYDQPDPFYAGQKVRRLFTRDIEKIHPLNRNKDWQEAIGYVSEVLSSWVANGMDAQDKVLLRRLGREIAPTSLRYKQEDNSSD